MGSIRRHRDKWRAEVHVRGVRRSKVTRTKAQAEAWVKDQEGTLAAGGGHSLAEAVKRYRETYTARKASRAREEQRLDRLLGQLGADLPLAALTRDRLAQWRDDRLAVVAPGSVRREWNLLNHILAIATREWEWIPANPLAAISRPKPPEPRSRVWTDAEVERFLVACGHPGETVQARVGDCLLFALETGMRAGEIVGLRQEHLFPRHVHLPKTKNGSARDVPLTPEAQAILAPFRGRPEVFGITGPILDALFRKARARASLQGIRFHDARRTALTRLAKRLDVLELARMSGHKDLKLLLDVYYRPDINDLSDKLN